MSNEPKNENTDSSGPGQPTDDHVNVAEQLAALNAHIKSVAKEFKENSDKHEIYNKNQYRLERRVAIGIGIYTIITLGIFIVSLCQVSISRDTEIRQLRAYVSITVNDPVDNFRIGQKAHVSGVLHNDGQTPAYDGQWSSGINVTSDPIAAAKFPYDPCQGIMNKPGEERWFLPKSIVIIKTRKDAFTESEINSTTSGNAMLYFHGRICYHDIYKEVRWTDFCFRWPWKEDHFDRPEYCDYGNDGDH